MLSLPPASWARRTGQKGDGTIGAPAAAAIDSATVSACPAARLPCFTADARDVPGRIDVLGPADGAEQVGRDEAVVVRRDPEDARSLELRRGDRVLAGVMLEVHVRRELDAPAREEGRQVGAACPPSASPATGSTVASVSGRSLMLRSPKASS